MPQMMPINWLFYFMFFIIIFILFNIMNFYIYYDFKFKNNYFCNKKNKFFTWKW